MFDIPGQVRKAINDLIVWIAATGLRPVLDTLGNTVLSTPDLTANDQVKAVWTTSLVTANGILVLFVIAGGVIVASRETLQNRYGLKEIAPRVAIAGVAANLSLLVCGTAIEVANALTAAIAGQGVDGASAAMAITEILNQPVSGSLPPILFSLLILAAVVMAIVVVITFILRTAFLVLLVGVAPLALTCHATPQTEGLAYAWWRALAACLGIQLGQAVIVLATVRVFLTPAGPEVLGMPVAPGGLLAILVCLTMMWLLIKLPGVTRHFVLGPLARRNGRGLVGQVVHAVILLKTLGTLAGVSRTARTVRTTRPGRPPGSGPAATRPVPGPGGPRPPRPSRPGRPRPTPASGVPARFSHVPTSHAPLGQRAGTAGAPTFSSTPGPVTARPAPAGGAPPARFSHPDRPQPTPRPSPRPGPARFSDRTAPATHRRLPTGPVAAPTFSGAPILQTAPKRPPARVRPVFTPPASPAAAAGGVQPPSPPSSTPTAPTRQSDPPPSRSVRPPRPATGASVPPSPRRPRGSDR
jgi:hypothetical protein